MLLNSCKVRCAESVVERVREIERGRCLLCVTAAACGEKEDEGLLPLHFLDSIFLSYSGIFCSMCAAVVFPTLWVFHVTSCVSTLFLFLYLFRAYILYSVVAERTSGERISTKWYQSIGFGGRNG